MLVIGGDELRRDYETRRGKMRTRGEVTRQDEMSRETDALPSNKNKKQQLHCQLPCFNDFGFLAEVSQSFLIDSCDISGLGSKV
uniref:Uncharacterized protein n=1 Tax=Solanum lycopersicum TaxID=4081 RepID=A0A3Q7I451_SOLLC